MTIIKIGQIISGTSQYIWQCWFLYRLFYCRLVTRTVFFSHGFLLWAPREIPSSFDTLEPCNLWYNIQLLWVSDSLSVKWESLGKMVLKTFSSFRFYVSEWLLYFMNGVSSGYHSLHGSLYSRLQSGVCGHQRHIKPSPWVWEKLIRTLFICI